MVEAVRRWLRDDPALLPPGVRGPATVAAALCALGLAVLALRYAGDDDSGRLDDRLSAAVDAVPAGRGGLARVVVAVGDPLPVIVIAFAMAIACAALGSRRLALLAVLAPGLTGVATTLLKPVIGRTFVDAGSFALPSGHTGAAAALGLVAAFVLADRCRLRPATTAALLAAGAAVPGAGMALALTVLDIHYPTDTVAGLCTAVAVAVGTALAVDRAGSPRTTGPRRSQAA